MKYIDYMSEIDFLEYMDRKEGDNDIKSDSFGY